MQRESISSLCANLRKKKFSSVELTNHYLERIKKSKLNAYITLTEEEALSEASAADALLSKGQSGTLTGIPFALKDVFCTRGIRTTAGSKMLAKFISPYDATVVSHLKEAGAVLLGKTNMDEFAMGSSNENSHFGPVKNPWNFSKIPGGSSGGSAAAVSGNLASFALGSDTGGSVRQPASFCGLTAIKPTYGRISRFGMIAYASSLEQAGPITLSAQDAAHVLQVISGFDTKDSTTVKKRVPDYLKTLNTPIKGLKIGLPKEFFADEIDPQVAFVLRDAIAEFKTLGATVVEVSLPHVKYAIPAYYLIALSECSSNLSRLDGVRYGHRCDDPRDLQDLYFRSRSEGFRAETKRRILMGTFALSAGYYDAYYVKAQKVRRLIKEDFVTALEKVDVLMGPVAPSVAPDFGLALNPVEMYQSDLYTLPVNLAGLPAISIPAGFVNSLPVGLQIIGNYWHEPLLLNFANCFQQASDWHLQSPPEVQQ